MTPIVAEPAVDEDSRLVAAVRRGDDRAFEALYSRYCRRIHGYVMGMVKDHGRAEDITQEVFVSALRRMRETERPIAFKPWIYEIAKNACIDQFRRSRRTEEISLHAEEGLTPQDYGRLVDSDPAPDDAVAAKQELNDLCGAFGGLSDTHHEILILRELEGLSYREIGERMGMSRPAVESTLFRARRRLTEEYDDLVSGARCLRIQNLIHAAATTRLGARESRRLSRHVSHCQPCRREALAAGLDAAILTHVPLRKRAADKVAALLPFPLFERWRANAASNLPMLSEQLSGGWGKLATAAAVLVAGVGVAGVGTEIVGRDDGPPAAKRATAAPTAAAARSGGKATTVSRTGGSESRQARTPKKRTAAKQRSTRRTREQRGGVGGTSQPVAPGGGSGSGGGGSTSGAGQSGGGGAAGLAGGGAPSLPKLNVPATSSDPVQTVQDTVDHVTEPVVVPTAPAVEPTVEQVTDTVTDALPGPVGGAVEDVDDTVQNTTGMDLP